jgi:hypothetical protein
MTQAQREDAIIFAGLIALLYLVMVIVLSVVLV